MCFKYENNDKLLRESYFIYLIYRQVFTHELCSFHLDCQQFFFREEANKKNFIYIFGLSDIDKNTFDSNVDDTVKQIWHLFQLTWQSLRLLM